MKHYVGLLLLLAACQPDKPAATAPPATPLPGETPGPATVGPAADTLQVADSLGRPAGIMRLRPSTKAAFAQLRATDPTTAADGPLPADGRVRRQGELLTPSGVR